PLLSNVLAIIMTQPMYIVSGIFLSALVYWLRSPSRSKLPLPPGPRKLPVIKNLLDVPLKDQWLTFMKWGEEYDSDVIHVEAAGNSLVILNSHKAMIDLLDRRSAIYSSRYLRDVSAYILLSLIRVLMFDNWLMVMMPYNDEWKERRRLFAKFFHPSDTSLHRARETEQLHILLNLLLKEPEDFLKHIRHAIGALSIAMAYGIKVQPTHDPYVGIAEYTIDNFTKNLLPGTFLADTFYWLRHIPEGLPGTGWKAKVRQMQQEMYDFLNKPFNTAMEAIANGTSSDSFLSRCQQKINEGELTKEEQQLVKDMASQVFIAGAESTVSSLSSFFLAIVCFPDVYKKAQAEVDSVLNGRLSEDSDVELLPYLNALLKEVLRWQAVFPMGVFHSVICNDEYKGYYIPKDSLIVPNLWAVFYDSKIFPEPEEVKPERFLKDGEVHVSGPDPTEITFGFGRRTCQGRHIAESTMFHIAASVLSLFDVVKATTADDKPIEPSCDYSISVVRQPIPFRCSIKPRSREAAELISSLL
ncbi:O-methylsterigmatocystin oxidoreductase, partial [Leucoagaricus sp. SymC.cos]